MARLVLIFRPARGTHFLPMGYDAAVISNLLPEPMMSWRRIVLEPKYLNIQIPALEPKVFEPWY